MVRGKEGGKGRESGAGGRGEGEGEGAKAGEIGDWGKRGDWEKRTTVTEYSDASRADKEQLEHSRFHLKGCHGHGIEKEVWFVVGLDRTRPGTRRISRASATIANHPCRPHLPLDRTLENTTGKRDQISP